MEEIIKEYCKKAGIRFSNGTALELEEFCAESVPGEYVCFMVDYQPIYPTFNKKTGAISLPDIVEFYVLTQGEVDEPTATRKPKVLTAIFQSVKILKRLQTVGSGVDNSKIDPVKVMTDTKMTGTRVTGTFRDGNTLSLC